MPSIAIYGDSGMGKTMIMKKFRREHPPLFDGEAGVERTRVLALLPAAALVLDRVLKRLAPERVVFPCLPPKRRTLRSIDHTVNMTLPVKILAKPGLR